MIGPIGATVNALISSASGQLFAAGSQLYAINLTTGQGTAIGGAFGDGSAGDLAFDSKGNLYMSTVANQLAAINPATGAETVLGPIGFNNVYGMAFGSDGQLYGLSDSSNQVIAINVQTGAGTAVWYSRSRVAASLPRACQCRTRPGCIGAGSGSIIPAPAILEAWILAEGGSSPWHSAPDICAVSRS